MKRILRVAILGTGKVGNDFLYKCMENENIIVQVFSGRRNSDNVINAKKNGIKISTRGVEKILEEINEIDVIVDTTNSYANVEHHELLKKHKKYMLNLTPSKIGTPYVPFVAFNNSSLEHNFITCGAQATLPILYQLKKYFNIKYLEIVSTLSSNSVGKATRDNISDYLESTSKSIENLISIEKVKTIITLNPEFPHKPMKISIYCELQNNLKSNDLDKIKKEIEIVKSKVQEYNIKYVNIDIIHFKANVFLIKYEVLGMNKISKLDGGNLDIITNTAIEWCDKKIKNE